METNPRQRFRAEAAALVQAARDNNETAVRALLYPPLFYLIVRYFLDSTTGTSSNRNDLEQQQEPLRSPFHVACPVRLTQIILDEFLLYRNHETVVNFRDEWGDTPLHSAGANGEYDHVRLFLQYGANINLRNDDELTPLVVTIADCWDEDRRNSIVALFFQERSEEIDLNHVAEALERAVSPGFVSTVELLLQAWHTHNGYVFPISDALVHFAFEGSVEVLEPMLALLLQYGANIHAQDSDGKTMFQKAIERSDEADMRCLLHFGATH